ncbi:MAG: Re/Si-specific NAD(P)(+) transhydrogenase subunit alpha [Actinomycetes bacterium]|nr:MAG: Re/Si-specific NAD(P)(+) transhydrogenase subunit alpha [Actinomycetota bacterium]
MVALRVGVGKETAAGERRVALVPDAVGRLREMGLHVLIESGAGEAAWHPDSAYREAGAEVVATAELYERADVVVTVRRPDTAALRDGQTVIGMLRPFGDPDYVRELAAKNVTAIAFEGLPRTISAAQTMDAMTSQDNIAGYKAAVLAAATYGRFFPLLVTAAGTARPAQVLVLGAGVAGLQAIGTARRLGAVVTGYDIRPEAEGEITSLGAQFLRLQSGPVGSGTGGYARALTAEEQRAQQAELARHIARHDVVITTARVPGRRPPLLVTEAALKGMRAGSVVVDMAASELGGNVEGSRPGETIVTDEGVTVIGAADLAATMPEAASTAYSSNVRALLGHLIRDGALAIDLDDPIQAGVVLTHAGEVVHPAFGGDS